VHELEGDHFVCVKEPDAFNTALVAACADVKSAAFEKVGAST
jgi:hypothetical protein